MLNGIPVFDNNNEFVGYRGVCHDVTKQHRLSEELAYQASFDTLTHTSNRKRFQEQLNQQIQRINVTNTQSYLCYLDLDRFKLVNDIAGHLVGDNMLIEVVNIFKDCIGANAVLGRLGGDEFGLILTLNDEAALQQLCQNIIHQVENYAYIWHNKKLQVGVSIGVTHIIPNISATELLSQADLACNKAKALGKGCVYFASLSDKNIYDEKLQSGYIANVSQAIEQNRFSLVKQPIVSASNIENVKHYEILLRFVDSEGQFVSPALFIPAAEKHGVIHLIDEWVVTTLLTRYDEYFPDGKTIVSINLSGLSISNEKVVKNIIHAVQTSGVDPQYICFEVTETTTVSNFKQALLFIEQMKTLGVRFAMDDFGSGTSSLGNLKKLPFDYLKIDGSLIKNLLEEPTDRLIVESIHNIATTMGMKTIAEFVENQELIDALSDIGIDYLQGYGIGKPIPC